MSKHGGFSRTHDQSLIALLLSGQLHHATLANWPEYASHETGFSQSGVKAALISNRAQITRTVQDANNRHHALVRPIVDGIGTVENDTQVRCKLPTFRVRQRKRQQPLASRVQLSQETARDGLRGFLRDVRPDFRQILFGTLGQAERAANSFLPRLMMRSASKALTRPAATSARP